MREELHRMATKIRGGDIERVWSISNIALQGVKTGRADASFLEKYFFSYKQGDIPFENGRSHCFVFFKGYGSDALCLKISSASCLTCLSIVEHLFIVARFH